MLHSFHAVLVLIFAACLSHALDFTTDLSGWQIHATDSALTIKLASQGVVWRSQFFNVDSRARIAKSHIGAWSHEVHAEKAGGSAVAQSASKNGNSVLINGSVTLASGQLERWTLQLAGAHGVADALSFRFVVERSSGVSPFTPFDSHCPARIQACYNYTTTDVSLRWELDADEKVVGGGEQYSNVNLRGDKFDIWSGEQGIGRGREPLTPLINAFVPYQAGNKHTSYSASPLLLSTRGYGVALDNTQLVSVDLTGSVAAMSVSFEDRPDFALEVSGHILGAANTRGLLKPLTSFTGRMQSPPEWALDGLVVGAEGGHERVSTFIESLLAEGVKVVGVWIQDWSGMVETGSGDMVWWNWELDEKRYPKPWIQSLSKRGIRVLTYLNPMLAAKESADGRPPSVFLEAQRLGYLVTDTAGNAIVEPNPINGIPYGQVDVFRNESWNWWVNLIRCNVMLACHDGDVPLVSGWMHDYGEQLLLNASVPFEHTVASDVHNIYPERNAAAAFAATSGFDNVTYFARAGALKTPGSARMFWLGDQLTSYDACDGLQSAIIGAMSGGFSGWTVTHSDLGGFTMVNKAPIPGVQFVRDAQLLVRWLETGVFINSMYRSHPGLAPNTSSQPWDVDVVGHTKNLTELFRALKPYRQSLLSEATSDGLPPVRHGLLVYPDDETWFEKRRNQHFPQSAECHAGFEVGMQQFFFGDEVLVAPVFAANRRSVDVYIPQGQWTHFWTGRVEHGPSHSKWSAPLGQPAVFYRSDDAAVWRDFFHGLSSRFGRNTEPTQNDFVVI